MVFSSNSDKIFYMVFGMTKKINLKIDATNITSSLAIHGSQDHPIRINEFLEAGMILDLPLASASEGHQLLLEVHLLENQLEILVFTATAKILRIENSDLMHATIKFVQFDPFIWKQLLTTFESRQYEIQHILESLKGET